MTQPRDDSQPSAANAEALVGSVIASQFKILSQLGAGGMGAVYLAEQTEMGRRVVIKVMHPELTAGNPSAVERFKREARAVAALNHPHIVQVYVFGQADDGRLYTAMEYIEGRDLAAQLKRHPLDEARALDVLGQVAAALVEAHSRGIVHRDLKPENIMLAHRHGNHDWVKVLDFGIAKVAHSDDAPALTQEGAIFGTPKYMAPEQITGGAIDGRTDLYALGVILFEMLTGRHPFNAKSPMDYLMMHVQDAVALPDHLHPSVADLLARLLAKDPGDRFQSAAELQRAVRDAQAALIGSPAASAGVAQGAASKSKTWPLIGVGVGVVALVAVLVVALGGRSDRGPPAPAHAEPTTKAARSDAKNNSSDAIQPSKITTESPRPEAVALPAAGTPIEGFPVPVGTKPMVIQPMQLQLESDLSGRELFAFYADAFKGHTTPFATGFELDHPKWSRLHFQINGDRIIIMVGRR